MSNDEPSMSQRPPPTTPLKLACLKRELAMRRAVYPRQVASGRLNPDKAARELELMEAIVADYERLASTET